MLRCELVMFWRMGLLLMLFLWMMLKLVILCNVFVLFCVGMGCVGVCGLIVMVSGCLFGCVVMMMGVSVMMWLVGLLVMRFGIMDMVFVVIVWRRML